MDEGDALAVLLDDVLVDVLFLDRQARRREVRSASKGSISSKLVASPPSPVLENRVLVSKGPDSSFHTSNILVKVDDSKAEEDDVTPSIVLVTWFKSQPKRRR